MKYFNYIFSLCTVVMFTGVTNAQLPEDVIKYSWQPVNGSARFISIGGASTALGGEITSTFTNPAGIGMYKTGDFVLSPGFKFLSNSSNFRGNALKEGKDSNFGFGTSGFVFSLGGDNRKRTSSAFSVAINRTAGFANKTAYSGNNDFSSFGEQYAIEAANSGLSIDEMLNSNNISYGTRMALLSYLVDTATIPGRGIEIISIPMLSQLAHNGSYLTRQSNRATTTGGITELALGYGFNKNDKVYLGGSLGFSLVNYSKQNVYTEADATGINNNYFDLAQLTENTTTKGVGVNLKMGLLIAATPNVRIGASIHTPTLYSLTDTYDAFLTTNLENYRSTPGPFVVNLSDLGVNMTPEYEYGLNTAWKISVGGTYILNTVEDVKQQKGFITGEIEYVTYGSNKFVDNTDGYGDVSYYRQLNEALNGYLKGALNVRVGGEMKFNTFMARLGGGYYGSPYADDQLNASRITLSGGIGFRNKGKFIDLGYVHAFSKDVNFPYRLSDKANTFANIKNSAGTLVLTLGFKI